MTLANIRFYCGEAARSLFRNRLLSLATVTTVAACILILGIAVLVVVNAQAVMSSLESNVEIVAFLEKDLPEQQQAAIGKEIGYIAGTKEVTFVSREKALRDLEKRFGQGKYNLRETLGGKNPLPDSYRIKATDPHQVPSLARKVARIPGVYKVRYGQGVVEKLFAATRWVRNLSVVVIVLLACAAVFLIATTIRLTIFSRRKEIYLMKLVGATNWFIRWPLFIEGLLLGLTGSLLAVLALAAGYYYLVNSLTVAIAFIPLVTDTAVMTRLAGGLLAVGGVLGITGTFISANRYLDV